MAFEVPERERKLLSSVARTDAAVVLASAEARGDKAQMWQGRRLEAASSSLKLDVDVLESGESARMTHFCFICNLPPGSMVEGHAPIHSCGDYVFYAVHKDGVGKVRVIHCQTAARTLIKCHRGPLADIQSRSQAGSTLLASICMGGILSVVQLASPSPAASDSAAIRTSTVGILELPLGLLAAGTTPLLLWQPTQVGLLVAMGAHLLLFDTKAWSAAHLDAQLDVPVVCNPDNWPAGLRLLHSTTAAICALAVVNEEQFAMVTALGAVCTSSFTGGLLRQWHLQPPSAAAPPDAEPAATVVFMQSVHHLRSAQDAGVLVIGMVHKETGVLELSTWTAEGTRVATCELRVPEAGAGTWKCSAYSATGLVVAAHSRRAELQVLAVEASGKFQTWTKFLTTGAVKALHTSARPAADNAGLSVLLLLSKASSVAHDTSAPTAGTVTLRWEHALDAAAPPELPEAALGDGVAPTMTLTSVPPPPAAVPAAPISPAAPATGDLSGAGGAPSVRDAAAAAWDAVPSRPHDWELGGPAGGSPWVGDGAVDGSAGGPTGALLPGLLEPLEPENEAPTGTAPDAVSPLSHGQLLTPKAMVSMPDSQRPPLAADTTSPHSGMELGVPPGLPGPGPFATDAQPVNPRMQAVSVAAAQPGLSPTAPGVAASQHANPYAPAMFSGPPSGPPVGGGAVAHVSSAGYLQPPAFPPPHSFPVDGAVATPGISLAHPVSEGPLRLGGGIGAGVPGELWRQPPPAAPPTDPALVQYGMSAAPDGSLPAAATPGTATHAALAQAVFDSSGAVNVLESLFPVQPSPPLPPVQPAQVPLPSGGMQQMGHVLSSPPFHGAELPAASLAAALQAPRPVASAPGGYGGHLVGHMPSHPMTPSALANQMYAQHAAASAPAPPGMQLLAGASAYGTAQVHPQTTANSPFAHANPGLGMLPSEFAQAVQVVDSTTAGGLAEAPAGTPHAQQQPARNSPRPAAPSGMHSSGMTELPRALEELRVSSESAQASLQGGLEEVRGSLQALAADVAAVKAATAAASIGLQATEERMAAVVTSALEGTQTGLRALMQTELQGAVGREVRSTTATAFRKAFQEAVVPAFEKAMQAMFEQVRDTLGSVLAQHVSNSELRHDALLERMHDTSKRCTDDIARATAAHAQAAAEVLQRSTWPLTAPGAALPRSGSTPSGGQPVAPRVAASQAWGNGPEHASHALAADARGVMPPRLQAGMVGGPVMGLGLAGGLPVADGRAEAPRVASPAVGQAVAPWMVADDVASMSSASNIFGNLQGDSAEAALSRRQSQASQFSVAYQRQGSGGGGDARVKDLFRRVLNESNVSRLVDICTKVPVAAVPHLGSELLACVLSQLASVAFWGQPQLPVVLAWMDASVRALEPTQCSRPEVLRGVFRNVGGAMQGVLSAPMVTEATAQQARSVLAALEDRARLLERLAASGHGGQCENGK